jgi:hypothetical protein
MSLKTNGIQTTRTSRNLHKHIETGYAQHTLPKDSQVS